MLKRTRNLMIMFLMGLLMVGASQCTNFPMDKSVSAAEGNDYTVVMNGFGSKSQKGYLFIQLNKNASTKGVIQMTFPEVYCKKERESCIRFQFFRKDGSAGYAGAVKHGETVAEVRLSDIIGWGGGIEEKHEGEYSVLSQVYFLADDGQEYTMLGNGFVRVNVLREEYRFLACDDPNVAWRVKAGKDCEAQFSTVYRSTLCGKGCSNGTH